MNFKNFSAALLIFLMACSGEEREGKKNLACNADPIIRESKTGIKFLRTPDSCFEGLKDFPYQSQYVEIDGLRQAYLDEGPKDADPILLLHGQPSWSYLYRKMVPVLVKAGHRVIAMDHLGLGRSDKPKDIKNYSFLGHCDRLLKFIKALGLKDITLFAQDWGSLIGLRVLGNNSEYFSRLVIGNGSLPDLPEGSTKIYDKVKDPDTIDESLKSKYSMVPPQQPYLRDKDGKLLVSMAKDRFFTWMTFAMKSPYFKAGDILEAGTFFPLDEAEESAYNAPFPSREYMAGIRVFPSLVNELPGNTKGPWEKLRKFNRPFLTLWGNNDPGNLGEPSTRNALKDNIPGSKGLKHHVYLKASHFLQDDQGEDMARRINEFIADGQ